jgi:dTDP-4-dehydrorhamnose reductase
MTRLLILGAQGQVGRALLAQADRAGIRHKALGRAECDITDAAASKRAVSGSDFVVNCAAYTAVDRAEAESDAARKANVLGARNIAAACAAAGIPLLHLSTDYVFDGESPWPAREDDPTRPLSVYGQSKLAGEIAVRELLDRHIILRTSWVFSAHGQNFVKTVLRLASTGAELRIVHDQVGGPTAADDIGQAILRIVDVAARPGFADWGTYHFSGAPPVSWFAFARAIVGDGVPVRPIATADYPRPARRPLNSVLDCSRISDVFGIAQPDWRVALGQVLTELEATAAQSGRPV